MNLDLRFTARPLESLWCKALVVFVFEGPLRNTEEILGIAAKTTGFLDRLRQQEFWPDRRWDTLLVAPQDRLRAEKLFLKGLGDRTECTIPRLLDKADEVGRCLKRLGVVDMGIRVPVLDGEEANYAPCVGAVCERLVAPFLQTHGDDPALRLRIIFSVPARFVGALPDTVGELKRQFERELECTALLERVEGGPLAPSEGA